MLGDLITGVKALGQGYVISLFYICTVIIFGGFLGMMHWYEFYSPTKILLSMIIPFYGIASWLGYVV